MRFFSVIFTPLFALLAMASAAPAGAADFAGLYRAALEASQPQPLPPEAIERARRNAHLLVAGFANEHIPTYYDQTVALYRSPEVDARAVSVLRPPSNQELRRNAGLVVEAAKRLHAASGGLPVEIVGHSNGGVAGLLAVLTHPELVRDGTIARLITLQSPLDGAPATTYLAQSRLLWEFNPFGSMITTLPHDEAMALLSYEHSVLENEFRGAFDRLSPADRKLLSDRIFYVAGIQDPSMIRMQLQPYALGLVGTANDGLVPLASMSRPEFGTRLAMIPGADHLDWVAPPDTPHATAHAPAPATKGQALSRALLEYPFAPSPMTPAVCNSRFCEIRR